MPLWIVWQTSLPTASTLHCTPVLRLRISINTHGNATESSEKGAVTGVSPLRLLLLCICTYRLHQSLFRLPKGLLIILCQDSRPFAHHFPILRFGVSTCTTKVPTDAFAQLITFRLLGSARSCAPLSFPHFCPACRDSVLIDFP